jgi:ubiquinone/menaquinone biosynthesis C-methylase UbiE
LLAFAGKVGNAGRVYAVDVKPRYLNSYDARRLGRLDTVSFVLGAEGGMNLPEACLDLVFARNVFHHLPEPADYFFTIKKYLKPGGKVAIIEHKPKRGFGFVALFKHHTPGETVVQDMEKAGYSLLRSFDFLPDQTFNFFGVNQPIGQSRVRISQKSNPAAK